MKRKKILQSVGLFFITCMLSCGNHTEAFIYECTGKKRLDFKILKDSLVTRKDNYLNEANIIYLNKKVSRSFDKIDTLNSYIQFLSNGYFIETTSYNSFSDYYDVSKASKIDYRCGYYSYKDSVVIFETWLNGYDGIYMGKAQVRGDSLIYYSFGITRNINKDFNNSEMLFIRTKKNFVSPY